MNVCQSIFDDVLNAALKRTYIRYILAELFILTLTLILQALWDWVILFLVIYTAIFTPYVAAFLLNEPGYSDKSSESYGSDPIVIIDLLGKNFTIILKVSHIF